jgi:hypothetical protein
VNKTADAPALDSCGCCEASPPAPAIHNEAALPAFAYRVGTHARFLERMRRVIPLLFRTSGARRPLERLTARTTDDPTIAFLDACAMVGDVLTFYQERIANEGFLRTAVERRSVLELARAIGYELSPGVAASVHLAFTVEQAPGAPAEAVVPRSTQVQSVPPPDQLPQVFETSADVVLRPEWNVLRPRLTRPAEMALVRTSSTGPFALHLLGASGTFPAGTAGLVTGLVPTNEYRLDTTEASAPLMDAVPVTRIYVTEGGPGVAKGDVLLFAGNKLNDFETLALRIADVVEEAERRASGEEIRRVRVDLEPLPPATGPTPAPFGIRKFEYRAAPLPARGIFRLAPQALSSSALTTTITTHAWREPDLHALLGIQRWGRLAVMRAINRKPPAEPIKPEAGAFAFRETLGFFGQSAPRWSSLPSERTKGNPYLKPWDEDDVVLGSPDDPVPIWHDSQGRSNTGAGADVFLERPVKGVTSRTWTVFETPGLAQAYAVHDARETARADFGIGARAMALSLRTGDGAELNESTDKPGEFRFRTTTARVASRRLEFAELPIETPLDRPSEIELDKLVIGLSLGQPIAVSGEREDLRGVTVTEIATLEDIVHAHGRTTLLLKDALQYSYIRDSVAINANVVHATHGETVTEVLGSGDGSFPNQRFALKKPPLTYVSAPTPRGSRSTLELRVNRVRWDETPSLYLAGSQDQVYTVRIDDDARAEVIAGDGEHGARLPSGAANVIATYRSGIGVHGEVEAETLSVLRTIPLGIRSVTNPVRAAGSESPERLDAARRNAPLTVVTFERIVSLADFEDFARTFPGIGKALVDRLWVNGRDVVHLTVAGATGNAPGADVLDNLRAAIAQAGDASQRVHVNVFSQRYFTIDARVAIDPRHVPAEVLAAVQQRLRDAFSFDQRDFGESVTPSEVLATIHEIQPILGVDLDSLAEYVEEAAPAPAGAPQPLVSQRARWNRDSGVFEPADLLLINPVGITLGEIS